MNDNRLDAALFKPEPPARRRYSKVRDWREEPLLMSVATASKYTGLGRSTIERLIHTGKLPYLQFSDAKKWIPRASIDKFIQKNVKVFGSI